MRALLLSLVLACTAAAQSAPAPTITVVDENGIAVPSARVSLHSGSQPPSHCQTDFNGRCQFPNLAAGSYQLHVEKEGFYRLDEPDLQIARNSNIDVAISRQQEVREVIDVRESAPAIDPAQVSSQETLSGLDVIDMSLSRDDDFRNVLNFIPGVVQDQTGQPHIAGGQTYQTETQLDGFNVTQPANGLLVLRVSPDAFRAIHVVPSREPAEVGKGPAGLLALNTGNRRRSLPILDDRTDPSVQNKHGWRFDQFLPRFTFSGPIEKGKIWFFNAFEGEYDNLIYNGLPVGQDNDHILRLGNLTKLQSNITSRNILTTSFLINYLRDQYAYLSPQSPQLSNPKDVENAYLASVKDQHYFAGGQLLETGVGFDQYNLHLTPYGADPFFQNENTTGGSFYLNEETNAARFQGVANLYLPPRQWLGRHDFKFGIHLDRISYDAQFHRQPYTFLTDSYAVSPAY